MTTDGDRRVARFLKTYKRDWSQGLPTGYDVLRAFKGVGFANPLPPRMHTTQLIFCE
jgi:hypothetical protein